MELKTSDVDESWLRSALECYWRSGEEGAAYVPCPKALRPRRTIFDEGIAWCIYLPTLREGYLVDVTVLDAREDYRQSSVLIRYVIWTIGLALLVPFFDNFGVSGFVIALYILAVILLVAVVPELVFIPWQLRVRRQYEFVTISPEVTELFSKTMRKVRSQTGKATASARLAGGVAGAIAGIFLGKLGEKATDILVEKIVDEGTEDYRFRSASRVIHEVSIKHMSNTDNAGKAGSE